MEKEDMMLVLLVIVVAIASLQAVQIFGMYGEANQVRDALGSQLQTGVGSGAMGISSQQPSAPQQGLGGC